MTFWQRLGLALVFALWLSLMLLDPTLLVDFFPLHFGIRRVLSGFSPYDALATAELARVWNAPFASAGIAYPLPALLLVAPLAPLPWLAAGALWTALGALLSLGCIRIKANWYTAWLLLLFWPLHRATVLGQATLLWFGLSVLLILGIRARRFWLVGICVALLVLKPQNGVLFALAGAWWGWCEDRRVLLVAGVLGGALALAAWALQPYWVAEWLQRVRSYQAVVAPVTLFPFGLVLLVAGWHLPWWAKVAALQVVLFPLSDVYSVLPLLLTWVAIGGLPAVIGASLSWLWVLLGLSNTISVLWYVIILPLAIVAAWRSWLMPRVAALKS